jgi:glutamyl-tRNA synthetase
MLAAGKAYRCYLTPAELVAMQNAIVAERELAKREKRPPRGPQVIQSPWRDRDPKEAPPDIKPVLRLKAPREGETVIQDHVLGRVVIPNSQLDDMIILRSDGTPLYNHAVAVDDHDMGITHIIRGADHLTNAGRQAQVYAAMGWTIPEFAHVPLILGPDGKKLSKRAGAPGLETFRAMGYLPAGLRNYLARLGWSHGDDEIFSTEQMVEWFDIDDINKSPARLDFAKLADVNAHYVRQSTDAELVGRLREYLTEAEGGPQLAVQIERVGWDKLQAALPSLKTRAKTIRELIDGAGFLLAKRPLAMDEKAARALDDQSRALLGQLLPRLESAPDWQASALEAAVRAFAETSGQKLGKIAQPLRAALTGSAVSPPVFDVLATLGKEEALARIKDQTR